MCKQRNIVSMAKYNSQQWPLQIIDNMQANGIRMATAPHDHNHFTPPVV